MHPPEVEVLIVRRSLLQYINQAVPVRPRDCSAQSKIRQDRLASPRRRIEHVNSLSKSDRIETVGHSDTGEFLPVRRPGNRAEMISAAVYDLAGGVFVRIDQPYLFVIPPAPEKHNF